MKTPKFTEVLTKDLVPGEMYYDHPDKEFGIAFKFVGWELDGDMEREWTLFENNETNKIYSSNEDGFVDFEYYEEDEWYKLEEAK